MWLSEAWPIKNLNFGTCGTGSSGRLAGEV